MAARAKVLLGIALAGTPVALVGAQEYDLSWYTIDGGGVVRSTGGDFELSGTIGQPDAGIMAGGEFELTGGFWFQIPPTDCNEDGVVSLFDYQDFNGCKSGPSLPTPSHCLCFDVDRDGDADLGDFAKMQSGFNGL
jgi:hypothetical protein